MSSSSSFSKLNGGILDEVAPPVSTVDNNEALVGAVDDDEKALTGATDDDELLACWVSDDEALPGVLKARFVVTLGVERKWKAENKRFLPRAPSLIPGPVRFFPFRYFSMMPELA